MTITLRIILIICSLIAFVLCIKRVKQSKMRVADSIIGSFILILMSIFSGGVEWISDKLGFIAPVNFVFLVVIGFLLIQTFIENIRISMLNEKVKNLNHYIALKEYENKRRGE